MSKFRYFLFIFILFLCPNVFALDVNVTNSITSGGSFSPSAGHYQGTEIYNTGTNNWYAVNTRYNGQLSRIRFNLPLPDSLGECFSTNNTYTITMEMATSDWRNKFGSVSVSAYNTNYATGGVTYVSYKKIYFKFKIPSSETTCIDYVFVDLKSTSINSTPFTGVSNWNLSKITLTDPSISSSGGGGSTPTPTPTNDYSSIINNQNENTQNIIENNDKNTQDIIDNNNTNTQEIVDNFQNKCTNMLDLNDIYQNNVGTYHVTDDALVLNANSTWQNVIYQIPVENGKHYYFSGEYGSEEVNSVIISLSYNGSNASSLLNDQFFNYGPSDLSSIAGGWSTDFVSDRDGYVYLGIWATKGYSSNNAVYYKMMFSNENSTYCRFGSNSNKFDETNKTLGEIKDGLFDDSTPSIDLDLDIDTSSPVSDLLTMPLTILNKVFDITDDTCSPYVLPFDFSGGNNTITLPCIDLEDYLGTNVYNILDTILCFYMCYQIGLMCVSIYEGITSLRDGFDSLYDPRHDYGTYRGRHSGNWDGGND